MGAHNHTHQEILSRVDLGLKWFWTSCLENIRVKGYEHSNLLSQHGGLPIILMAPVLTLFYLHRIHRDSLSESQRWQHLDYNHHSQFFSVLSFTWMALILWMHSKSFLFNHPVISQMSLNGFCLNVQFYQITRAFWVGYSWAIPEPQATRGHLNPLFDELISTHSYNQKNLHNQGRKVQEQRTWRVR